MNLPSHNPSYIDMNMELEGMHSPESIESAVDFSGFQDSYEQSEQPLFSDICIGFDEDSDGFGCTSKSLGQFGFDLSKDDSFSNNDTTNLTQIQMSALDKSNYTESNTFNKKNARPLTFISLAEENNRKRYPIGDSNSKNAIAARDNRLKKKKYVSQLEDTVRMLRSENKALSGEVVGSRSRLSALESEVQYLKSVIANQSTLSAILSSVSKTPGISLSTSFGDTKKSQDFIVDNNTRTNELKPKSMGRCLRSKSKFESRFTKNKGVQKMTAEEIVQQCNLKNKRKIFVPEPESVDSETDSEVEIIDADDSFHKFKSKNSLPKDYGGVCLHVSGTKVSLEFCASCNTKSNSDVSLDHSYSSFISK